VVTRCRSVGHVSKERESQRQGFGASGGVQPLAAVAGPRRVRGAGITYVLIGVLAVQIGLGVAGAGPAIAVGGVRWGPGCWSSSPWGW
jgi:hypothetical protein